MRETESDTTFTGFLANWPSFFFRLNENIPGAAGAGTTSAVVIQFFDKVPVYVITYNRSKALSALVESFARHGVPCDAIIDDGSTDRRFLKELVGASQPTYDPLLDADVYTQPTGPTVILGRNNVGVAGNSNRALELFRRSGQEHLCLCNDDIIATGNFVIDYAEAHKLGAGMLCFTPKDAPTTRVGRFRVSDRIYGAMISVWKDVVDKIGYFDTSFGRFGHEHCDYTHRARIIGAMGSAVSLDVLDPKLELQDTPPSLEAHLRENAEARAEERMELSSREYFVSSPYREFSLEKPRSTGVNGVGITFSLLQNVVVVRA